MRIDDRFIGLAILAFALCIILQARHLPAVPGTTYGPDLMPTLVGLGLAAFAIRITWQAFQVSTDGPFIDLSNWHGQTRGVIAAVWTVGGVIAGMFLIPALGFPLFGLIYGIPLMLLMRAPIIPAIVTAVVVVFGAQYIFSQILYVPLSAGLLPLPW